MTCIGENYLVASPDAAPIISPMIPPRILIVAIALLPIFQRVLGAPSAAPWQTLEGVTYKPQRWDDGDSFHVTTSDGKELILRLYFVDTCEEEKVYADRIKDQAEYFGGLTDEQTKALGRAATEFTRKALEKPFRLMTRWHKALGRSKQNRWYCVILTADGKDLAEELVRNGLARIYGTRTVLWDGRTSKEYDARLAELEEEAKREKRGGWGVR
jgi:endonuclease YncB( thermonuclease family)